MVKLPRLLTPAHRQIMLTVDHRLALGDRPVFASALSKKSFSRVSWPILARRSLRSTAGAASALASPPNTQAAASSSWSFHRLIWLACTSNGCASSLSVFSPRIAVSATFALNACVWFRLARIAMISPAPGQHRPRSGEIPPIGAVQFPRAASMGQFNTSCPSAALVITFP